MSITIEAGDLRNEARVYGPGTTTSDGDGGFTTTATPLSPPVWRCSIEKATARLAERRFAATVISQATHILTGRFHPRIDTQSSLTWVDRAGVTHNANVLDVDDTEGAGVELVVLVAEVVT